MPLGRIAAYAGRLRLIPISRSSLRRRLASLRPVPQCIEPLFSASSQHMRRFRSRTFIAADGFQETPLQRDNDWRIPPHKSNTRWPQTRIAGDKLKKFISSIRTRPTSTPPHIDTGMSQLYRNVITMLMSQVFHRHLFRCRPATTDYRHSRASSSLDDARSTRSKVAATHMVDEFSAEKRCRARLITACRRARLAELTCIFIGLSRTALMSTMGAPDGALHELDDFP